jgi:hypothetical protein
MEVKKIAFNMLKENSAERRETEKMFGVKFDDMTQEQRRLAAICLSAFNGVWNKRFDS